MHRELDWPVSKATCLYANLYMVYINLYKIIEGTRPMPVALLVVFRRYLIVVPRSFPRRHGATAAGEEELC
jgi:hypothetical protein